MFLYICEVINYVYVILLKKGCVVMTLGISNNGIVIGTGTQYKPSNAEKYDFKHDIEEARKDKMQ